MNRVIVLEFNELCPSLMERFIDAGGLPNFERLRGESLLFTTDAEEPRPNLEPWILWVNMHTGVSQAEHGVFNLGEARLVAHESIWDSFLRAGGTVWICGSMNAACREPIRGAILPDPWSTDGVAHPGELADFYRFVRTYVQEHTNTAVPLTTSDYLRFLRFIASHGLAPRSIGLILRQLIAERFGGDRWRRATLLDRLQWDVFRWYYRQLRPDLATFFLNSTAHYQHKFWRNMQPELFSVKPGPEEASKQHAIRFGYEQMDGIVGEVLELAAPDTTIVLCTALSQQPYLLAEASGGKRFYRPGSFDTFVSMLQLGGVREVAPVMSEQFHIFFSGEPEAITAEAQLGRMMLDGRRVMYCRRTGPDLFVGCTIFDAIPAGARVEFDGRSVPFFDLFYQADSVKSGMHHPDGMLWIRTPARSHAVVSEKVPLRSVAPTILRIGGVPIPRSMQAPPVPIDGGEGATRPGYPPPQLEGPRSPAP